MLSNRVREFRKRRELTQNQLAEAISVSRQTIYSIENKKVVPTIDIAIKMAAAMKTKVETLFFFSRKKLRAKLR